MYSNSLQHYGVLGMKWGVRRTPEQLGHRKEAKLEKYKAKESAALKKRRLKQLDKQTKAAIKSSKKGETETPEVAAAREALWKTQSDKFYAEWNAIKNLTYKDMQKEKLAVGRKAAKSAILSVGSTAVAALTPIPVAVISWPNTANIKTNMRLNNDEDKKK